MDKPAQRTVAAEQEKLRKLRATESEIESQLEQIEEQIAHAASRRDEQAACLLETGDYVAEKPVDPAPLRTRLEVCRRAIEMQKSVVNLAILDHTLAQAAALRAPSQEQARKIVSGLAAAVTGMAALAEIRSRVRTFNTNTGMAGIGDGWLEDELRYKLQEAARDVVRRLGGFINTADVDWRRAADAFYAAATVPTPVNPRDRERAYMPERFCPRC
jgi:hypothetical protein